MAKAIPRATALENLKFSLTYTAPGLLRGAFTTNPRMLELISRLDANRRASHVVERMRSRYGGRSLWVRGPTGPVLLIVNQGDVRRVLTASDHEFSLASPEKVRGLGMFQPDSLVLSPNDVREDRHAFNNAVLDTGQPVHKLGGRFRTVIHDEMAVLLSEVGVGVMTRQDFDEAFARAGRRILFGDSARDDRQISALLRALRREANWMGLRKWRTRRNAALLRRLNSKIQKYADKAESGSLMSLFAGASQSGRTNPAGQVAHWLMAFDVLGMGVMQTMALLACHPEEAARAAHEIEQGDDTPYLRACLMEGLRMWAPVPNLMRITTEPVDWHGVRLPAGVNMMIPAVLQHRSPQVEHANEFAPEAWLDGSADNDWWINPFSKGPGQCPGSDLALFAGPIVLAALLRDRGYELLGLDLTPGRPLPQTINAARFRFAVHLVGPAVPHDAVPQARPEPVKAPAPSRG